MANSGNSVDHPGSDDGLLSFDDLVAGAEAAGPSGLIDFDELSGRGASAQYLDPRDVAAQAGQLQQPAGKQRPPYLGAIGAQNAAAESAGAWPRGTAGVPGSSLSDGMAEVAGFFSAIDADSEERASRRYRPAGAGVMWDQYGGSLKPTIEQARSLGLSEFDPNSPTIGPIRGVSATPSNISSYLAGTPSAVLRQARGVTRAAAGALTGSEHLLRKGERELSEVSLERESTRPRPESTVGGYFMDAADSLATMLTGAAGGLPGVLGTFALSSGAESYSRLRSDGVPRGRAAAAASAVGASEAATELIPVKVLLKSLGGKSALAETIAHFFVGEIGGEMANSVAQTVAEEMAKNPEMPVRDAVRLGMKQAADDFSHIVGVTAAQTAMIGPLAMAAGRARGRGIGERRREDQQQGSDEARLAVEEMKRQQAQAAEREYASKKGAPVGVGERWDTAKRAFTEERDEDGNVVYVSPSGARITPEQWNEATQRVREAWLTKPQQPAQPRRMTPEEILAARPDEQITVKPPQPTSERLELLRKQRSDALSQDVKRAIDREIRKELNEIEKRNAAEEFAAMAQDETDPQRKALLWNAAAKLVVGAEEKPQRPSARGIVVKELSADEALRSEPEKKPSTRGLSVTEIAPEEIEASGETAGQAAPDVEAEIERAASETRSAEHVEPSELPSGDMPARIAREIKLAKEHIGRLDDAAASVSDKASAKLIRSKADNLRRKVRDLSSASNMLAEAASVEDVDIASELRRKASSLIDKHIRPERERKKISPTDRTQGKVSSSALLRELWGHAKAMGRQGLSRSIMADIGVEEPVVKRERTFVSNGKVVKRVVPVRQAYRMEFGRSGELFSDNGINIDEIVHAMSERGYLPPAHVMEADNKTDWAGVALEKLRQEIENPGSVRTEAEELDLMRGAQEEESYDALVEEAKSLGLDVRGKSFEELLSSVSRAIASDWTSEVGAQIDEFDRWMESSGLTDTEDAVKAAMVRAAVNVDEDAVERASVVFENDEDGFMRSIMEILNGRRNEGVVQGGSVDAGKAVQGMAGADEGASAREKVAEESSAADEVATRGEQVAGAGASVENAAPERPGREPGPERDAEAGRAADVTAEGTLGAQRGQDVQASVTLPEPGRQRATSTPPRGIERQPFGEAATAFKTAEDFLRDVSLNLSRRFGIQIGLVPVERESVETIGGTRASEMKAVRDLFGRFGVEVKYFRTVGERIANGFYYPGRGSNVVWLDVEADRPLAAVAGHEFGHWLEEKHPDLWNEFASAIDADLNLPEYRRKLAPAYSADKVNAMANDANLRRELVSDILGDAFSDVGFHAQLIRDNPNLYRRIARALVEFIDTLLETVLGRGTLPFETNKYVRDLQKARSHAKRMLSALGERVDKEQELRDAVQAAMEQLGIPGKVDDATLLSIVAAKPPPSEIVSLPDSSVVEARLFDSFNRVAELEEAYRARVGVPLPDEASARLAEKLFHGRVQHRANVFERDYLNPLGSALKGLKKVGLTIRDADDYLMALHAPERNATLRARDPQGRDGLSGLTDADARGIVASFSQEQLRALEDVRKGVRRVVDFRLDTLVNGGLIGKQSADYLRQRWPNYVPLKSIDTENKHLGVGMGFELWATDIRAAFGRTTRASTPIGFALSDAVRAIVRAEKARVEQAIWKQANTPELSEIIRPYDPENPPREVMTKRLDAKTREVRQVLDPARYEAHVMSLVIDGEQRRVFIADETLRRQLARAGEFENLGALLESVGYLTRTLGRTLTEWNPNWFLPNAVKDAIAASIKGIGIKDFSVARMLSEIPVSWKHIVEHKLGMRTRGARLYEEFSSAGGITGAYGIEQPEEFLKKLVKRGADVGYMYGDRSVVDKMADPLRAVLHGISVANEVVEYATRFAAYKAAREAGYSVDRSAEIAKEITVNFNRRGEMSRSFGSLFVFFNAAMQGVYGTAKFFGAGRAIIMPGSLEHKKVIAGAAALMTLGALMQGVNEFFGGDDDETGDKVVNGHSDFILDHNVSLVGLGEKGLRIAKVPLPPEYSAFYAAGRRLYRAASQGNYAKEAAGIAGNLLDSSIPLRLSDETAAPIGVLKAVLPSVLTPVAEVATNTNFLGASIVPDPIGSGPTPPYHTISRTSTSKLAKSLSVFLNEATGGDDIRPGASQKVLGPFASPEAMEHLVRSYTGGLGQSVLQTRNVAGALASGATDEFELSKLPVVPRFYSERSQSFVERKYRDIADKVQYEKRAERRGMRTKDEAAVSIANEYEAAESALRPLYRTFRELVESGDRESAKAVRNEVIAIKAGVVRAYNQASRQERR